MEEQKKIAKKNQAKGNRLERTVAQMTGGVQVGDRGGCDIQHPLFKIECKEWDKIPGPLKNAWLQAQSNARNSKPMLIMHESGSDFNDSLVIIDMKTAIELKMFKVVSAMEALGIEISDNPIGSCRLEAK